MGLIGEGTGIVAKVLKSIGINLKDARVEEEKIIGRGSGFVTVEIPFTPRAKCVFELSLGEACQHGSIFFYSFSSFIAPSNIVTNKFHGNLSFEFYVWRPKIWVWI